MPWITWKYSPRKEILQSPLLLMLSTRGRSKESCVCGRGKYSLTIIFNKICYGNVLWQKHNMKYNVVGNNVFLLDHLIELFFFSGKQWLNISFRGLEPAVFHVVCGLRITPCAFKIQLRLSYVLLPGSCGKIDESPFRESLNSFTPENNFYALSEYILMRNFDRKKLGVTS